MSFPEVQQPFLPPTTVIPEIDDQEEFIRYMNRQYEEMAFCINSKDFRAFKTYITSTPINIPNVGNTGAYIICVAGANNGMPSLVASLIKTTYNVVGNYVIIQEQAGSTIGNDTTWNGKKLTINNNPATATTNFQISHNAGSSIIGNFYIKVIGTQ